MRRRQVLQMGAAVAALPLVGCGASTPEPKPAPPGAGDAAAAKGAILPENKANDAAPAQPDKPADAPKSADKPKDDAPKSTFSRVVTKLGKNHGHELTVSFSDVQAGAEKTFNVTGSTHPHTVTLTADEMKSLLAGQIVRTKSTLDKGHKHRVRLQCAPPVDPPEWVTACKVTFSGQDEHEMIIPAADIAAKVDKTYDVQGVAGHTHEVTVSAAQFEKLAKKEALSLKASIGDAHTHVVLVYP